MGNQIMLVSKFLDKCNVSFILLSVLINFIFCKENYYGEAKELTYDEVKNEIKNIEHESVKKLAAIFSSSFELEMEYGIHELLLEKITLTNNKDFICSNLAYNLAIIKEYTLAEYFINQISEKTSNSNLPYFDKNLLDAMDWVGLPIYSLRNKSYEAQLKSVLGKSWVESSYRGAYKNNKLFHRILIINRLFRNGYVDQGLILTFNEAQPKKSTAKLSDWNQEYQEINGKKYPMGKTWSGKLSEVVAYNDAQDAKVDIAYNIIIPNISAGLSMDILNGNINKIDKSNISALAKCKILFKMIALVDDLDELQLQNYPEIKNDILNALKIFK